MAIRNATLLPAQSHEISFGPTILPGGGVRFRLWAPQAEQVELILHDHEITLPMTLLSGGLYENITPLAKPGTRYQYRINGSLQVPDPASRFQPEDVHGPSCVIDPDSFCWQDTGWQGRPWEEAVIYELHVGTFTPEGTFKGVQDKLDYLVALGITAIELMPVSDFAGNRNWGYDGVLPYAPDSRYGHPDDLKALVQAAHQKGLMVFLDVVYNHFGPEGNYLHTYAKSFFTPHYQTPWGEAINFEEAGSNMVRAFFIENALYWLREFHMDGLRLDAVHAIYDASSPSVLEALADAVQNGPGQDRRIHLVLENDDNIARYLVDYTAQWNDDIHHALHVLLSDETGGYYRDYADNPAEHLARCLTEGFDYQGQPSPYRQGDLRGEPSQGLPLTRFVSFIQNHDQVGNRAFGDRLTTFCAPEKVKVAAAIFLLSPQIPLLFMGEEWACDQPFPFFCDFEPDLSKNVREGRRQEFAKFPEFNDPARRAQIPDPCDIKTFESAILNWQALENPEKQAWLAYYRILIELRRQKIVPLLKAHAGRLDARYQLLGNLALQVFWKSPASEDLLCLVANFGDASVSCPPLSPMQLVFETTPGVFSEVQAGQIPPLSALWLGKRRD